MKRFLTVTMAVAALTTLAACGENPQTMATHRQDKAAHTGTDHAYMLKDWKPGDKASWESRLKARQQYGQNDYTRMN